MKDEHLFTLFKEFVFELYPQVAETMSRYSGYLPKYDEYPQLSYGTNGMPIVTKSNFYSPERVRSLFFSYTGKAKLELKEFHSYQKLSKYLHELQAHRDTILPDKEFLEDKGRDYDFMLDLIIEDVLERYWLLNETKEEDETLLQAIYLQFENYTFAETLTFDISVPILFLNFDVTEFSISEKITIRKIEDNFHRARLILKSYSPPIADALLSSATHELVFKDYFLKKESGYLDSRFGNEKIYPLEKFEQFFSALKIVSNLNSGFAQVLTHPNGWTDVFYIDLPPLKGTSVKKYPNYFDDFYWTRDSFPMVTEADLSNIGNVFLNLLENKSNKIQIANRRLRNSYLRDNEEDAILDIIIGIEVLLGDNDKGETTHKLALRVSRLLMNFTPFANGIETFGALKKIYGYRSAIVHGSKNTQTKNNITLQSSGQTVTMISLASDFLREILRVLLHNPEFLEPKEIDKLLLQ